ncbi:ATPase AAA-type core [Trinorchestia longiramus]|nr:ATPase AAA-type core [Trinorchestia longiramus]
MPPKGILLHGPPGCGKTLIAKALTNEIEANFINFDISTIKNKWVGETEKMATALFSVARKLEPCIIFIDEWDGLTTDSLNHVVVLAASNRIDGIDDAILRRLPLQFEVPLPKEKEREDILKIILKDCDLHEDVDLEVIASQT